MYNFQFAVRLECAVGTCAMSCGMRGVASVPRGGTKTPHLLDVVENGNVDLAHHHVCENEVGDDNAEMKSRKERESLTDVLPDYHRPPPGIHHF